MQAFTLTILQTGTKIFYINMYFTEKKIVLSGSVIIYSYRHRLKHLCPDPMDFHNVTSF